MRGNKRFFRRGRSPRRSKRVVWFVPPGRSNGTCGADESCYADQPFLLKPIGSPAGQTHLSSPIVWNLQQGLFADSEMGHLKAHPISERWTIERIVGQIQVSAIDHQQPALKYYGISIAMGIAQATTLGDAVVDPSPLLNASANARWMWKKYTDICNPITLCATCQTDMPCGIDTNNACTTHNVAMPTTKTPSEVFGLPTAKWIPVDVSPRRTVRPEETVSLHVEWTKATPELDDVDLYVTPKLRVLLSRTV